MIGVNLITKTAMIETCTTAYKRLVDSLVTYISSESIIRSYKKASTPFHTDNPPKKIMKFLSMVILTYVTAVNCQTAEQVECIFTFLLNPSNMNIAIQINQDCPGFANLVRIHCNKSIFLFNMPPSLFPLQSPQETTNILCDLNSACSRAQQPVYTACSIDLVGCKSFIDKVM
jgi:hypothetical protein